MSQLEYERRNLLVKWRRKDYEGIPKRMREQQRALTDVCGDPDIPNYGSWVVYARKHPELREKVRRIVFTFPYSAQIKTRDVSPNLQKDCERLRASGMTTENIAKALGIPRNSVFRVLRGFDEKMGLGKYEWGREDFETILNRIRWQQRTLKDVCKDPDLPGVQIWLRYIKSHPEFATELNEIYHRWPYSLQAKVNNFSPRFRIDCERLRAREMTIKNVAKTLGVSDSPVSRVLQDFDEKMGFRERSCGPEGFEAILDRIREQQRPLNHVCKDPDSPCLMAWLHNVDKHPEFNTKLEEVYHRMSYPFQASVRCLSPRFRIDCERLRAGGMSIERISKALGLSQAPVRRALRGFDEKMGLWNNKWRREKFETILDRIREQQRPLQDVCGDPDLPTKGDWVSYAKKHPEFITKLKEVYHNMSYPFQARVRNLSPRFRIDCERLYAAGMSINKIVKILGVSYSSVRNVL